MDGVPTSVSRREGVERGQVLASLTLEEEDQSRKYDHLSPRTGPAVENHCVDGSDGAVDGIDGKGAAGKQSAETATQTAAHEKAGCAGKTLHAVGRCEDRAADQAGRVAIDKGFRRRNGIPFGTLCLRPSIRRLLCFRLLDDL